MAHKMDLPRMEHTTSAQTQASTELGTRGASHRREK